MEYIYFGSYPQCEVLDDNIINDLNKLVFEDNWIDFNYYDNDVVSSFMWYQDVIYDGNKYRGVRFNKIRYGFTNREGYTPEDVERLFSHIKLGTIYWFKFEDVKWIILDNKDDELLLISDLIIDHMEFYHSESNRTINNKTIYANNWEHSNIRKWLNDNFYEWAFNEIEKEKILLKEIDNHNSFNNFSSIYLRKQNDTYDKVYLLSYHESLVYFNGSCLYDESKLTIPTKYAIINNMSTGFKPGYKNWFLRTPCNSSSYMVHYVSEGGNVDKEIFTYVLEGIRPVINIKK